MSQTTPRWSHAVGIAALCVGCAASPAAPSTTAPSFARACEGKTIHTARDAETLSGCTTVHGDLTVLRSELRDMRTLGALREITGTLTIAQNWHLSSLRGLEELSHVRGVVLRGNPELGNLKGLQGLTKLETLEIKGNGLYSTSGLENLRSVDDLVVEDNRWLVSLAGLNRLEHALTVRIENNPSLCTELGLLPDLEPGLPPPSPLADRSDGRCHPHLASRLRRHPHATDRNADPFNPAGTELSRLER